MSITFYIAANESFYVTDLNVANANAAELFGYIGLHVGLWDGEQIYAQTLLDRIDERLTANPLIAAALDAFDGERPPWEQGRVIHCARRPGYLREKAQALRDVCEQALEIHPSAKIYWG